MRVKDIFVYRKLGAIALRNILRNPRHSIATVLAIAFGFLAVCLFDGYLRDFMRLADEFLVKRSMMGHVVIQKQGYAEYGIESPWGYVLTPKDQEFVAGYLKNAPGVRATVRFLDIVGMLHTGASGRYFIGYGYDVQEGLKMRTEQWAQNAEVGLPLHLAPPKSIVLGKRMGRAVGCENAAKGSAQTAAGAEGKLDCRWPRVTLSVSTEFTQVNSMLLSISGLVDGIYENADKHLVLMSLRDAQQLMDTDKVSMITVALDDPSQAAAFASELQRQGNAQGLKIEATRSYDHPMASFISNSLKIMMTFRHLFLSILVIIAIMSVINSMVKSVNERFREIGMIRSLGYHRTHIMIMFGFEGFFIGLIACGLTLPITLALLWAVNAADLRYDAGLSASPVPFGIAPAPLTWLASCALFVMLAALSAWIASRKAANMNIADSMRFVA